MSAKVLSMGPAMGSVRAFVDKQRALHTKHSFSFAVAVGDFFGSLESAQADADIDALLAGALDVPLTTYIMVGENPLPPRIQAKVDQTGGEVCPNVFFIGNANVLVTSEGVKIAAVGGAWDQAAWDAESKPAPAEGEEVEEQAAAPAILNPSAVHLTPSLMRPILASPHLLPPASSSAAASQPSLASLKNPQPTGVDILLLHSPPPSLSLLSPSCTKLDFSLGTGAVPFGDLVRRTRPRYIFWAGGGEDGFWEREPFGWTGADGRYTRAIKIGNFGGPPAPEGKKKPRSFYAFSISPLAPPFPAKPANATPNPFSLAAPGSSGSRGEKRGPPLESQNFIWQQGTGAGGKKPRRNAAADGEAGGDGDGPRAGYICKICNEPGHFIQDCPQKSAPRERPDRQQRELGPAECWFCLSNPKVTKHLIVSIGSETYVTLPKGQLPPTISAGKMVQNKITGVPEMPKGLEGKASPVPGGGHVLIIPISHYPTLMAVPPADAITIIAEIEQTKSALRDCYKEYGCVPVAFEVGRLSGRGGHAHVQVVPVPSTITPSQVSDAFKAEGLAMGGLTFEDDPDRALASIGKQGRDNYFRVDLPGGGKMVHLMEKGGRFDLQFGRVVLAKLLGLEKRIDWKACAQTDQEEKADAAAFKKAFSKFSSA